VLAAIAKVSKNAAIDRTDGEVAGATYNVVPDFRRPDHQKMNARFRAEMVICPRQMITYRGKFGDLWVRSTDTFTIEPLHVHG
jgi:hypothetical protein